MTLAGWWVASSRDTDRQDPTAGVTTLSDEAPPDDAPALVFRDVAAELGIVMRHGPGARARTLPEDTGSGLAWGDFDGDGDFDLYLVNLPSGGEPSRESANRLYRNDGDGFVDVTDRAGVGDADGFGMGASFADYDGDGDQDLYVANRGPNRLFNNRGNGTFADVAAAAGVDDPLWSVVPAWADFDRDGRLDLYVANYVEFDDALAAAPEVDDPNWTGVPVALNPNAFDPEPNRLYRQEGASRFVEDALSAGVSDPGGRGLGVAAADLDGDGRVDLYVANDVSPNALFLNRSEAPGELLFSDESASTGTADPRGSMGICIGQFDSAPDEPRPSLFVTHWVAQENALYLPVTGAAGRLEYRDRARQLRLAEMSLDRVGWGCAAVDLDRDGRLDLVAANGSTLESPADAGQLVAQRMLLLWNAGERFFDLAAATGGPVAEERVARGLGAADFDRDGDLDLAVAVNRGAPLLLSNETAGGHGVQVRLNGPDANAIGTRLELSRGGIRQTAWWRADASFASAHAAELVFGLAEPGAATLCTHPPSGRERCFVEIETGHTYQLPVS